MCFINYEYVSIWITLFKIFNNINKIKEYRNIIKVLQIKVNFFYITTLFTVLHITPLKKTEARFLLEEWLDCAAALES